MQYVHCGWVRARARQHGVHRLRLVRSFSPTHNHTFADLIPPPFPHSPHGRSIRRCYATEESVARSRNAAIAKEKNECQSSDESLGHDRTLESCAAACRAKAGCQFFVFGIYEKAGRCYHELTSSASCPEGWESDSYDFYQLDTACQGYTQSETILDGTPTGWTVH